MSKSYHEASLAIYEFYLYHFRSNSYMKVEDRNNADLF
jgi:hypothetical protein